MEIEQPFCPSLPRHHNPWSILYTGPKYSRSTRLRSCFSRSSTLLQFHPNSSLIYKYLVIKTYNMIGNTSCIDLLEQVIQIVIQLTLFLLRSQKEISVSERYFLHSSSQESFLDFSFKETYLLSEDNDLYRPA